MSNRILFYGMTQGTGALLAEHLLSRGFRLRAVVRNPTRLQGLQQKVEVVQGDLTQPDTLRGAAVGIDQIVFTAGVTQRPAPEALIKATEYEGVRAALDAAKQDGFHGRFLYMTSLGVNKPSFMSWLLNKIKGNTLVWRREAEAAIKASGLPYTIVRAGILVNEPEGKRPLIISQGDQPLGLGTRVARADIAALFVELLTRPHPQHTLIEAVAGPGQGHTHWEGVFNGLRPDTRLVS
jgi:uncharacterized protein YbjT (DUF2867 family)